MPTTEFRSSTNKPVYGYLGSGKSSFRRALDRGEPFTYQRVDPAELTPNTEVALVPTTGPRMTFLRNVYLAKGIAHTQGDVSWLVLLDGKLAGGFIYVRDKFSPRTQIYLLSDFAIAHERRLAKLIAMLALSKETHQSWCHRFIVRPAKLRTTAFTDKPVSMKYRGIYELTSRKEGRLEYTCEFRGSTAKAIYLEWLGRFGQAADADRERPAAPAAPARKERSVHGRARVQPPGGQPQA